MELSYVYWIFDETCEDVSKDGYVGVSLNPKSRFRSHIRKSRVPSNASFCILFEGTREDCFELERSLRPSKGIGWNSACGGAQGFRYGFIHSNTTKEHLKSKWTPERRARASEFKKNANKLLVGQKRPKQSLAMRGQNNPMFGVKRPQNVIDAISRAHKGKKPVNRQELYCIRCRKRASYSRLLRYHNKC